MKASVVPAASVTISDATALPTTGLTPRQFRAALRRLGVPHVRLGRRTLCRADAWSEAIDRAAGAPTRAAANPEWDEDTIIAAAAGGSK